MQTFLTQWLGRLSICGCNYSCDWLTCQNVSKHMLLLPLATALATATAIISDNSRLTPYYSPAHDLSFPPVPSQLQIALMAERVIKGSETWLLGDQMQI